MMLLFAEAADQFQFSVWHWVAFLAFVVFMLALDLGVFNKKDHVISISEALGWSAFWIMIAMLFNAGIWYFVSAEHASHFLQGYVVEKALSVDNLFVFLIIFKHFEVPEKYQHRVLFWGILAAILLRGVCIGLGAALIAAFSPVMFLFGLFLLVTGIKLLFQDEGHFDPNTALSLRLLRRVMPITNRYDGARFFTLENGVRTATPMFVVLIVINAADIVFAVDSIPAIFGITTNAFIVFTSNIFAIFGLRALYFALAALMHLFVYLKYGLSLILVFIGAKMIYNEGLHYWFHGEHAHEQIAAWKVNELVSLGVVLATLAVSMLASVAFPSGGEEAADHGDGKPVADETLPETGGSGI
jgi:tellurite resistance protein TerC